MSKKTLFVIGITLLLIASLAIPAMAAQSQVSSSALTPSGTRPTFENIRLIATPMIYLNGDCEVGSASGCPSATPGG